MLGIEHCTLFDLNVLRGAKTPIIQRTQQQSSIDSLWKAQNKLQKYQTY